MTSREEAQKELKDYLIKVDISKQSRFLISAYEDKLRELSDEYVRFVALTNVLKESISQTESTGRDAKFIRLHVKLNERQIEVVYVWSRTVARIVSAFREECLRAQA